MVLIRFFLLVIVSLQFCGCASFGRSMKEFLGGKKASKSRVKKTKKRVGRVDKRKNYRKTDHKSLQEKSRLGAASGSLWVERGQGAYLFTQNTNRLIGDLVNVEVKGNPKKQIETKVAVIQNLIEKIRAQAEERKLAAAERRSGAKSKKSAPKKQKAAPKQNKKSSKAKFDVKIVPSRITEILKDGSYVVQGDQPFMIGRREYKLMVRGIVRQEDFDDQGISAEMLLDPKFDIVTNRKKR